MIDSGFVVPLRRRIWLLLLLILSIAVIAGFTVILYGEREGFSDDPGRWAGLSTQWYAWISFGLLILIIAYFLVLLVRREIPARTYQVPEPYEPRENMAPSFLSGSEGPPAAPAETQAEVVPAASEPASTPSEEKPQEPAPQG